MGGWLGAVWTPGVDGRVETSHRIKKKKKQKQKRNGRKGKTLHEEWTRTLVHLFLRDAWGDVVAVTAACREEDGCVTGRIEPAVACV